jgi:hypothetical protein
MHSFKDKTSLNGRPPDQLSDRAAMRHATPEHQFCFNRQDMQHSGKTDFPPATGPVRFRQNESHPVAADCLSAL